MQDIKFNSGKNKWMTQVYVLLISLALVVSMGLGGASVSYATGEKEGASLAEIADTGNNDACFVKDHNTLSPEELAFDGEYILNHFNRKYVKNKDLLAAFRPVTYMRANASYTKKAGKEFSEGGKSLSNVISSANYVSMVYDVDPEGDYYVALPDVNRGNKDLRLYSVDVIYNNDQGELIEDAYFDKDTSILYIPKKYVDKPKAENSLFDKEAPVAVQMAYQMDLKLLDTGDADFSKKVPLLVFSKKTDDKSYFFKDIHVNNMFDVTTLVPSFVSQPERYTKEDFTIMLNGMATPVDQSQYSYNRDNGEITLAVQAAAVSSISIALKKHRSSAAARLLSKVTENVYADEDDDETEYNDPANLDDLYGLKINNKYVYVDSDEGNLYDKMYVGWRGSYGDYDSGPDTVLYGKTKNIRGNSKYVKAAENYLYGAFGLSNAWAIISYATSRDAYSNDFYVAKEPEDTGSNEISAYKEIYNTIEKNASGYTPSNKKTIFAWMNSVRTHLSRFVDGDTWTEDDKYYSKAPGKKKGKKNNMGAMMFAFQFPSSVKGSSALLDKAELQRLGISSAPKFGIKFASDQINSSNFLPGVCRHFSHAGPHQDGKTGDKAYQTKVFMTCLGKGEDQVGRYLILEFATAEKFSDQDQNGYAVYKFYTTPKGWVKVKKSSSAPGLNLSLAGAEYVLLDPNDNNQVVGGVMTTDANGNSNAIEVPQGSYILHEQKAASGFHVDEDHGGITVTSAHVSEGNALVAASTDRLQTGYIGFCKSLKKAWGTTSDLVGEKGAVFQVWNARYNTFPEAQAAGGSYMAQTLTQEGDAPKISGELLPGTYYVKQISAGNRKSVAKLLPAFTMEVAADKWCGFYSTDGITAVHGGNLHYASESELKNALASSFRTVDIPYTVNLNIKKLSEDHVLGHFDTCSLKNEEVTFKVESVPTEDTVPGYSAEKTVDKEGKVIFERLCAGTYRITETHAAKGYYLSDKIASATVVVGILGDIRVVDQISHDDHGILSISPNTETSDNAVKTLTWARKNTPQNTTLSIDKKRSFVNEAGKTEVSPQPGVEFNLYAAGDILAYDGHGDHVYYKDGQLIQGVKTNMETGERTYYVDGHETKETKYRIITNKKGRWDSMETDWKYYPLTNQDSYYELVEQFVWCKGDHIAFSQEGKEYLLDVWEEKFGNKGTDLVAEDMSFQQMLAFGVDLTRDTREEQGHNVDTDKLSSNGALIENTQVINLLNKRVLKYAGETDICKDDLEPAVHMGTIVRNTDILDPTEAADMLTDKFQVLPFGADRQTTEHASTFVNDQTPKIGTKAGLAEGNVIPEKGKCAIVDTVAYSNLTPGSKYTFKARLYDKKTGKDVKEGGKLIEARQVLVPKTKNGTVQVEFDPVDGALISGDVVIYETLYQEGELVINHEDPDCKPQTVLKKTSAITQPTAPEKPGPTDQVQTETMPKTPVQVVNSEEGRNKTKKTSDKHHSHPDVTGNVRTGDPIGSSHLNMFIPALLMSAAMLGVMWRYRRRRYKKAR